MKETVDFIKNKYAFCGQPSERCTHKIYKKCSNGWSNIDFNFSEPDKVTISYSFYKSRNLRYDHWKGQPYSQSYSSDRAVEFHLKDLSTSVSLEGKRIEVKCGSNKACITRTLTNRIEEWKHLNSRRKQKREKDWKGQKRSAEIPGCDSDTGSRIQRALIHAIKLAGGKDELF